MTKPKNHELEEWLSEFNIEYPDEDKIDQTIMQLHQYVPKKKKQQISRVIPAPLRNAYQESLHFSSTFWISNLVYLAIGLIFVLFTSGDPYMALLFLAPLPVLIGLVEIFRSRDEGMIELELSLTYSPSDLMLSKLAIVGFFNLACNLLLIVVINFFAEPIVLIELLKYWAVPYLFVVTFCLFLSIRLRAVFATPISIAILITLGLSIAQLETVYHVIPDLLFIVMFFCAMAAIGLEVKMIKKGAYHEFNN
jgi:hypothetical protein